MGCGEHEQIVLFLFLFFLVYTVFFVYTVFLCVHKKTKKTNVHLFDFVFFCVHKY
jgi:hypothetical protein